MESQRGYIALLRFLYSIYQIEPQDSLGALLGGMELFPDGSTADPAYAHDWNIAVSQARSILPNNASEVDIAYRAALFFLDEWLRIGYDKHIATVRQRISEDSGWKFRQIYAAETSADGTY